MEDFKNLQETQLSSQPIFDGDVLHIFKDTIRLPNGKQATREYTVHHGAVCILPLLENGDVLLEHQFRYPMATPKIFESEYRFCLILWECEPVSSAELAKICKEKLGWSRTTTYTVIHRLSERGVVKNEGGLVSSLVSKDEAQAAELDALVEKTFEGSLPAFVAAFARKTKLSQSEVDQLRAMIDGFEEAQK